jgi:hypothetical protein
MATTFQLKRSSVQGKLPNVGDLQVGELAVNLADGILYSKNTTGNIVVVGSSITSNVTEGVNLYFTNTRAISAFTAGNNIEIASNGLVTANISSSISDFGGFVNSTLVLFPFGDLGSGEAFVSDAGSNLSDAFGVSLFSVYDYMEPIGRVITEDLEVLT